MLVLYVWNDALRNEMIHFDITYFNTTVLHFLKMFFMTWNNACSVFLQQKWNSFSACKNKVNWTCSPHFFIFHFQKCWGPSVFSTRIRSRKVRTCNIIQDVFWWESKSEATYIHTCALVFWFWSKCDANVKKKQQEWFHYY